MARFLLKSCLVFLCFLAFIGCEHSSDGQLRVQVFTGAYSSIPIHVADELGFFSRRGLSVQKVPANSSSAALAAMIGGSLDIVESGVDLVMANIDKGIELRYLMSNEGTNYVTFVVGNHINSTGANNDYREILRRLRGYRIGVNAIGSTVYLAAVMMLEDAGFSTEDFEFVATGTAATTLSAWQSRSVDAQFTFAPVPEILENLGIAETLFVLADNGPSALRFEGLYGGWVTTNQFLEVRSEDADAFISATVEAIDWIRDPRNGDELLSLAHKYSPVSGLAPHHGDEILKKMIERYRRFWGYEISHKAITKWNKYAMHFDLIKDPIAFDRIVYSGAPVCEKSLCR